MSRIALVLVLLAGCFGSGSDALDEPPNDGTIRLDDASRAWVRTDAVTRSPILARVDAPGRVAVRLDADARMSVAVAGKVDAVHVREGARVSAGDPLFTLDSGEAARIRAELSALEVELELARAELARQERLAASGVGLEVDRLRAQADVERAHAAVTAARHEVQLIGDGRGANVVVRAPIDGVVVDVDARPGLVVGPDSGPLVTIARTDDLHVRLEVYDEDLRRVAVGQDVDVHSDNGAPIRGRVVQVADAADPGSRRGPVLVEVDQPHPSWVPGRMVRGSIHTGPAAPLAVPVKAVVLRPDRTRVVYVETAEGALVQRPVSVGRVVEDLVPVLAGLEEMDRIVVDGALLVDSLADSLL